MQKNLVYCCPTPVARGSLAKTYISTGGGWNLMLLRLRQAKEKKDETGSERLYVCSPSLQVPAACHVL